MNAGLLYRVASVLLVFFALGHTVGFLKFKPPTPEGASVWEDMNRVHFKVAGKSHSYGGFYLGFGLFNSIYLLFSALLAWHLSSLSSHNPQAIGILGWAFCLVMVGSLVLCWVYFNVVAVALSALVAVCLGWASWLVATVVSASQNSVR